MQSGRRDGHYGSFPSSSYNAYQSSQQQQQQQQSQHGQQQDRRDSFDHGDDANIAGNAPHRQQSYPSYAPAQSVGQSPDLRSQGYPSYAGSPAIGAQQQQQQHLSTQMQYNPASYAQPSPQMTSSPVAASPHIQMPPGNYAAAHVPYNPAAYQNPSPQPGQGSFAYQPYNSPPMSSYNNNQSQMPPLPPKPPELAATAPTSAAQLPRPGPDRRGAVSTASPGSEHQLSQRGHSSAPSYSAYQPPAPPSHGASGGTPNSHYQAYTPPLSQGQQPAPPPPPQHRRLPTIPQGTTSPVGASQQWAPPRVAGASLPSDQAAQADHGRQGSNASATGRPLPSPPQENAAPNGRAPAGDSNYDDIFAEVEAAVMGRPGSIHHSRTQSRSQSNHVSHDSVNGTSRNYSVGSDTGQRRLHDDVIAASGVEALRIQEQDEANLGRDNSHRSTRTTETFMTGTTAVPEGDVSRMQSYRSYASTNTFDTTHTLTPGLEDAEDVESDDGAIGIDISGGFDPGFGYSQLSPPPAVVQTPPPVQSPPATESRSPPQYPSHRASSSSSGHQQVQYFWAHSGEELVSPRTAARVDTGGTGGFVEPTARRMSFDEDDEATLIGYDQHQQPGASARRGNQGVPQRTASRPLPPTPEDSDRLSPNYPQGPDKYESNYEGPEAVRKTNSLNYTHGSNMLVPGRSITDAEQRRKGQRASFYNNDGRDPAFPGPGELDLPAIPDGRRRKFAPNKLSSKDFALCEEPWAVSNILAWLKEMTNGESDLKEQPLVDALVGLFTHKVPTMNIADAEVLGASLIQGMITNKAITREEEWVKFSDFQMTGVIFQLTGHGCYSPRVHTTTMQGRCYSQLCMRTLKKIDLQAQQLPPEKKTEDWASFYKLKADDVKDCDKKEIELQNNLHEIVTSEDYFVDQLDVLLVLYRDGLANSAQSIIALTGKQSKFINEVFGKVPAIKKANEDHLLAQLKYRQQEQGPWVKGFSDIFREWIRRAKGAYIEYAYNLPNAIFHVKSQVDQNVLFKQFLDQVREHPRSRRLDWNTYLKAPVTRLQRYGLLLETVRKNMRTEAHNKEKANLETAIREIKEVTLECDAKVAEMTRRTDILDLTTKLKLRPGMEHVHLNLNHLGREIIHRGDLMRRSANNMSWVENHVILFDHYMVLAKPYKAKEAGENLRAEYYDVSKHPIDMDLLVLDSADDGTVTKHGVNRIIPMGPAQVSRPNTQQAPDLRLTRTQTGQSLTSPPQAQRSNSSPAVTAINTAAAADENIMYPFRIQHLGKSEVYVLYAPTAQARAEWIDAIVLAKRKHAASLFAQSAEPFKLRVLADISFAYGMDSPGGLPVHIPGTPLDRALRDIEREHPLPAQIQPICRSAVNCATTFTPHSSAQTMLAVGTDFGVYITHDRSPRSWYKAINATHVTQIQVLEDFSVLLIVADKALIAFHLDGVIPPPGVTVNDNSAKKTPQKLSGSRDVGFFAVGRMKERMLVFYKKRDGISSTFKVLEPVYQKSNTSHSGSSSWGRSRFGLKKGNTDFFRDFDDFYIATDTYGINLFASSLAIASAKGIEVLTLDKKLPFSIPDLRGQDVQSIAARLAGQKPLGMFRLSEQEFLLVFESVGVYVDKHGDISRTVIMQFVGKARQAALHGGMYLVLVDATAGYVEVRNANNGRLRQIISGRDVRMLDDGMGAGISVQNSSSSPSSPPSTVAGHSRGTIKISMQHPEIDRGYVVLEMQAIEGMRD